MVLHGFTWFYMVLHGFTWFYMVLHGFTWFYMVLYGFTWFYMVLHGFTVCSPTFLIFFSIINGAKPWRPILLETETAKGPPRRVKSCHVLRCKRQKEHTVCRCRQYILDRKCVHNLRIYVHCVYAQHVYTCICIRKWTYDDSLASYDVA